MIMLKNVFPEYIPTSSMTLSVTETTVVFFEMMVVADRVTLTINNRTTVFRCEEQRINDMLRTHEIVLIIVIRKFPNDSAPSIEKYRRDRAKKVAK